MKPILDACCGSRMFWFDKNNPNATFVDKRKENCVLCDGRTLVVEPDVVADFTNLPFLNKSFYLVVFDPPHLVKVGKSSWLAKKYGRLNENWRDEIKRGFEECFRVLKNNGTLIFKWNEADIPVSEILKLSPRPPLFGNRTGRLSKSHWITFLK